MLTTALVMLFALAPIPPRVAAAANLSGVLEEIEHAWSKTCPDGCGLKVTYGASGSLEAQIENGAPFDIFLSADMFYAKKLAGSGLADRAPFVYARGKLALWVPPGSSLAIEEKGIAALRDSSVRHIAIGNPTLTPYGRLALVVLEAARLDDPKRLVLGESVGQAAQQAQSGSVQAALLPLSLVLQMPGRHIEMPGTLEQGGVILTAAHEKALARSFVDFLLSGEAKKIFARHGYAP